MSKSIRDSIEVPAYEYLQFREKKCDVAVIIPVINEGYRLLRVLENIKKAHILVDIIIADGGSDDNSTNPEDLSKLGVTTLLTLKEPGKLSSQLRMAFFYSLQQGYKHVITMDGNDKDDVTGMRHIITCLKGGIDFVQGSRFLVGGKAINTPLHRLLGIKLIHAPITSLFSLRKFTDSTNGFRGFSRKVLEDAEIGIFRNIFFSYELLAYLPIRISRLGYKTAEVPVCRSYPKNAKTPTKIKGLRTHLDLIIILFKAGFGKYNPKKTG